MRQLQHMSVQQEENATEEDITPEVDCIQSGRDKGPQSPRRRNLCIMVSRRRDKTDERAGDKRQNAGNDHSRAGKNLGERTRNRTWTARKIFFLRQRPRVHQ